MESWLPWLTRDERTLIDVVGDDAQVLLCEPRRMRDRAADLLAEEADLAVDPGGHVGGDRGSQRPTTASPACTSTFDRLLAHTKASAWHVVSVPDSPDTPQVQGSGWDPVVGDGSGLRHPARSRCAARATASWSAPTARARPPASATCWPARASTPRSTSPRSSGVRCCAASSWRCWPSPTSPAAAGPTAGPGPGAATPRASSTTSKPGDYVVHHQHGVARYGGMVKRAIGGVERDYLLLEYKGDDKLYVPSDQIDAVRHYTGGDSPSLSRLGGDDWQRTKAKVRAAVAEIAQELVVLYQKRLHEAGPRLPARHAVAAASSRTAFPYQETPDQLKAIADVKADMEEPTPMDRLVCGDVGFGKTEVAIRAAFKAVQDGKQVAVLVPTTLLAQQHFQTFSERFAGYPVRVEVLSRFLTPGQAQEGGRRASRRARSTSSSAPTGCCRDDVTFKDLGLLVVDEEQRFGVSHKEQIKQFTHRRRRAHAHAPRPSPARSR